MNLRRMGVFSVTCIGVFLVVWYIYGSLTRNNKIMIHTSSGVTDVRVSIADDERLRAKGLMGVEVLPDNTGMWFIFENNKEQVFWNKDTLVSLDVVWIRDGRIVGMSALPRSGGSDIVYVHSPLPVDRVLEVPSGFMERIGAGIGDVVDYP